MRDDIERFRKLANTLLSGETLTKEDILKTMGISIPTLDKLLNENLATIKVYASVLAKVQDFNKIYCEYQGIDLSDKEEQVKKEKKSGKASEKDLNDAIRSARELLENDPPPIGDKTIWTMLRDLEKALPKNMSIQLIINSRK
jgi:DNA-binding CsgD family transcriptional regulator